MKPKKMFLGGLLGRKTKDEPVKKATRRGRGPGRTRQTRMDDMKDAQDAQKPGGVSDRKQVFAKGALDVKKAHTTAQHAHLKQRLLRSQQLRSHHVHYAAR